MQKKLLFFLFLLVQVASTAAQITLEHTYEGQFVARYKMPVNGEFYFAANNKTMSATFPIYGSNHAILRQIPLAGDPLRQRGYAAIAETPSGALRILNYVWDSTGTLVETENLSDDNGRTLFSQPRIPTPDSFAYTSFLRDFGLPTRLVSTISDRASFRSVFKLYDLNGQNAKIFVDENGRSSLQRTNLEVSGEKFYRTNGSDSIFFYNTDLTFWKKFKIPSGDVLSISQTIVNTDSLIEIVCSKNDGSKLIAVNELGQEVSSVSIERRNSSVRSNEAIALLDNARQWNLYTFRNGLRFVKTYPEGLLIWQNLGRYGTKYISMRNNSDTIMIYNEDQTLWRTVVLPLTQNYRRVDFWPQLFVIENAANNSSILHVAYIEVRVNAANTPPSNFRVIDENGISLLKVDAGSQFSIPQYPDLPLKILVWSSTEQWTKVYGFPNLTATSAIPEKLAAQAVPNPFDKTLIIKLETPNLDVSKTLTIQIVDITGKILLKKQTAAVSDIPLPEAADLPSGFYFLTIKDSENRQAVLKIVKN